ncbi:hypothetical protein VTJ04DRAFT_6794 [Mycothermus thermophilus]|uniref:uncharacterized protein n=1 Tax=Humicola insolens TaxID=85995 RepID=UPI003742447D
MRSLVSLLGGPDETGLETTSVGALACSPLATSSEWPWGWATCHRRLGKGWAAGEREALRAAARYRQHPPNYTGYFVSVSEGNRLYLDGLFALAAVVASTITAHGVIGVG